MDFHTGFNKIEEWFISTASRLIQLSFHSVQKDGVNIINKTIQTSAVNDLGYTIAITQTLWIAGTLLL